MEHERCSLPTGSTVTRRVDFDWPAFLLVAVPVCILVAMRGDTRDTIRYIDAFEATRQFPANPIAYYAQEGVEWGFGVLCWAVHLLGLGWRALFLIVSVATFSFLALGSASAGLRFRVVLPFYLCSFFVVQQLMQIRQGLGMAMAYYVLIDVQERGLRVRHIATAAAAVSLHSVALVPLLFAMAWRIMPAGRRGEINVWHAAFLVASAVIAARIATRIDVFSSVDRLASYAESDTFHAERGILQLANLRAVLMLILFLAVRVPSRLRPVYSTLVALYAFGVGIRLGFFDFEVLSGRVGSAAAFGEVFALPMVAWGALRSGLASGLFTTTYFVAQGFVTLAFQVPFIVNDYLSPIARSGPLL